MLKVFHIWKTFSKFVRIKVKSFTMNVPAKYKVVISEEVDKFLETVNPKARAKIFYNIHLVSAGKVDRTLFKKLDGTDIWEFRTLYGGIAYRLLAFFDEENKSLIITTHGFIKKTQKTPQKEIDRAKAIRTEYFNQK